MTVSKFLIKKTFRPDVMRKRPLKIFNINIIFNTENSIPFSMIVLLRRNGNKENVWPRIGENFSLNASFQSRYLRGLTTSRRGRFRSDSVRQWSKSSALLPLVNSTASESLLFSRISFLVASGERADSVFNTETGIALRDRDVFELSGFETTGSGTGDLGLLLCKMSEY